MWELDTTRHYKIWFSNNPDSFLGMQNQRRLINMRQKNPAATLSLVYSSQCLTSQAQSKLKFFCTQYQIQSLDFDKELPALLEEKEDCEIYNIAKKALNDKEGGSKAEASDCVRTLVPLIEKLGIYSDFDVKIDFSSTISLPVKAPVIVPSTAEGLKLYINADFIAVAHEAGNPNKLSAEGIKAIRAVQQSILWRYNTPLVEAFSKPPLPGFPQKELLNDEDFYVVLINYAHSFPKSNIFDFRKYVFSENKSINAACMSENGLVTYCIKDKALSALKSALLSTSVVMFSGADNYYALYSHTFPKEGFNLHNPNLISTVEWIQIQTAMTNSGLKENGLTDRVKSGVSSNLANMTLGETAGVYRDASWTNLGMKRIVQNEASVYATAHRYLFNYRAKHLPPSAPEKMKAHYAMLKTVMSVVANDFNFFEPIINSLINKNYSQALRRACSSKHPKLDAIVAILLRYKDKLNIQINEQAGDKKLSAIDYAEMKNNQVILDLLKKQSRNAPVVAETKTPNETSLTISLSSPVIIIGTLGKGAFATVFKATYMGAEIAVKRLHSFHEDSIFGYENEVKMLRKINPLKLNCAPKYVGDHLDITQDPPVYDIYMELIRGEELYDVAEKHWQMIGNEETYHMPSEEAAEVLEKIMAAGVELANHGVVHNDLNNANIMITQKGEIKIIDWAFGACLGDAPYIKLNKPQGTPPFMAFELCNNRIASLATEAFSLGGIIFYVSFGMSPYYYCKNSLEIIPYLTNGKPSLIPDSKHEHADIIQACWDKNPDNRPKAQKLHEYFSLFRAKLKSKAKPDGAVKVESSQSVGLRS